MAEGQFTRREVDRAFRKFRDVVADLMQADMYTWGDSFTHFMEHCERNPVMRAVTDPLRNNPAVDAAVWLREFVTQYPTTNLPYKLPVDDDERTALLYKLFWEIEYRGDQIDFPEFCLFAFGVMEYDRQIGRFNAELVKKFVREVLYRLDEVTQDIGNDEVVSRESVTVFHYHDNSGQDHSMKFHGNIQGSNVAIGGSSVTGSTATYQTNEEVAEVLKGLKPLVKEVASNQREAVEAALQVLIEANNKNLPVAQVATAAQTVGNGSPKLKDWLLDLASKTVGAVATGVVVLGIKQAFHIP